MPSPIEPTDAAAPSPQALSAANDLLYEELMRVGVLAESYSRSIVEAAFRGDAVECELHVRRLKACVLSLVKTFKELTL